MSKVREKLAHSLVVMTASSSTEDEFNRILELANRHNIRSIHIQQLEVPKEEANSQIRLTNALKYRVIH